jgi:hypothetical protein
LHELGDFIDKNQHMRIGNSVNFGKFLKKDRDLKCMFHSLISITPSGKLNSHVTVLGMERNMQGPLRSMLIKLKVGEIIMKIKKLTSAKNAIPIACMRHTYTHIITGTRLRNRPADPRACIKNTSSLFIRTYRVVRSLTLYILSMNHFDSDIEDCQYKSAKKAESYWPCISLCRVIS